MFLMIRRALVLSVMLLPAATPAAMAQDAPVRVRGTIERVEGDTYVVKARGGAELKVKLADKATVVALTKATAGRHQAGQLRRRRRHAAAGRQPEGPRGAYLSRGHARHRRRAPRLGPAAVEHHDQRQRRADDRLQRWPGADAQVQGRREEDRRSGGCANRRLCARRHDRAQARCQHLHRGGRSSSPTARCRHRASTSAAGSRRRCDGACYEVRLGCCLSCRRRQPQP